MRQKVRFNDISRRLLSRPPGNQHPGQRRRGRQLSRKESRKQERVENKQKRAQYFAQASAPAPAKRPAPTQHQESPKHKKPKLEQPPPAPVQASSSKPKSVEKKIVKSKKTLVAPPKSQKEIEDDKYIAYLEAKLGYASGKGKKKQSEDDGLDGVSHVFCDSPL